MTPEALAEVHASCFPLRPWRAAELRELIAKPQVTCLTSPCKNGFALVQTVAGEAEILTIAVHPVSQRQGVASALMRQLLLLPAAQVFLEVAADNTAARALYHGFGFEQVGQRNGYYRRSGEPAVDALILGRQTQ
ncbi:GNAT family N-acetyltransferase [Lentibacter algarum]|uniref:GNAT family N-acetyltransferase n=1 Tax=Lentibacter algarum TaxID=576131 RepID=UPI001C0859A0|nr:GNAT family N-acetyltransferase [Lentibacter algarum]MBU2983513.1 GNAT family N-acetyltransferase [Lentibacter algarum]